jgi:anhydro-N-acetylmuramic acid kinase
MIAVGLMSGTSLDGIDAALVRIVPSGSRYDLALLRFETFAFDSDLLRALNAVLPPATGSVPELAALHRRLGEAFGDAARAVAESESIGYVASHGQTVWHDGAQSITLQIGDAFAVRERLHATVCYDFRSADCAAGGQGAPLVAHVDELLFSAPSEDRAALNLGGIANVTLLPKGDGPGASAFDTGPANMLLDAFVRARSGGRLPFDRDGRLAATGRVNGALLDALLADEYFEQRPPKSTGRERFGPQFLAHYDDRLARLSMEDGLATLAELTAASVADALLASEPIPARLIVAGGGARNRHLLARIAARLPETHVETSDAMGIPADAKEAMAFAVLGYETLRGRAANVTRATGAARAVPLGAIAPYELSRLLDEVQAECRCS